MQMSDQEKLQSKGAQLSPELQWQYLDAMGIQCWQNRYSVESEEELIEPVTLESVSAEELIPLTDSLAPASIVNKQEPDDWLELESSITTCTACELHQTRSNAVVAEGEHDARFMFISTAPAINAEATQNLLAKEASQLFTNMLQAIDIKRQQIYFTSLLKCQLPEDRKPRTTEIVCCEEYLRSQIDLVKPELIVALGEISAQHLIVSKKPLDELRGTFYRYHSVPLIAMPHPDDLLLNPQDKRKAWHDLLSIKQKYNA